MGGATNRIISLLTTTTPPLLPYRYPSLLRLSRHRRLLLPSFLLHQHNQNPFSPPLVIKSSHQLHTQTASSNIHFTDSSFSPVQPWPEWSNLIKNLSFSGYFNRGFQINDELIDGINLSQEFTDAVAACLAFANEKPQLLGMLSRKNIEVVVAKGMPFLFKNGRDSKMRLLSFLGIADPNEQITDEACTTDLVKFLLSYASNLVSSESNNMPGGDMESSVRELFSELAQLSYSLQTNFSGSVQNQFSDRYGQASGPLRQSIEMKRGDWVCSRCSFLNFARNVKCLECEEARPKRQPTQGEWECPQCDFFNYRRNRTCLRCDCKRPGEVAFGSLNSRSGLGNSNMSYTNRTNVDSGLAANEGKSQWWFSKISQMDDNSNMKKPLERRLANVEYQRNSEDGVRLEGMGVDYTAISQSDDKPFNVGQGLGLNASKSTSQQHSAPRGNNYVPFVPLPADMFANKTDKSQMNKSQPELDSRSLTSSISEEAVSRSNDYSKSLDSRQHSEKSTDQILSPDKDKEQAEKSERWFKRVAELHDVTDLASAIPDEDFPEIMPLRKGENRFVVSKRKDRSLTSPAYKRRTAMEQANDTNFVPFVPFPSNYFAQKDNQPSGGSVMTNNASSENSNVASSSELPKTLDGSRPEVPAAARVREVANQHNGVHPGVNSSQSTVEPSSNRRDSQSSGYSMNENITGTSNSMSGSLQNFSIQNEFNWKDNAPGATNFADTTANLSKNQNIRNEWTGKSLEGSAVKEPDPLDMSEEAKAERWFRRVAQIKDISELSQIPDEDFPSIMPMRKGVNRFVVSKRKTPLERRLTSTQYRRNLPTVSSDPNQNTNTNEGK